MSSQKRLAAKRCRETKEKQFPEDEGHWADVTTKLERRIPAEVRKHMYELAQTYPDALDMCSAGRLKCIRFVNGAAYFIRADTHYTVLRINKALYMHVYGNTGGEYASSKERKGSSITLENAAMTIATTVINCSLSNQKKQAARIAQLNGQMDGQTKLMKGVEQLCKAQKEELSAQIAKLEADLRAEKQRGIDACGRTIREAEARQTTLRGKLDEVERSTRSTIATARQKYAVLEEERDKLANELAGLHDAVAQLGGELGSLKEEKASWGESLQKVTRDLDSCKTALAQEEQSFQECNADYARKGEEFKEEKARFAEDKRSFQRQLEAARNATADQLRDMEADCRAQLEEAKGCKAEKAELETAAKLLKKARSEARELEAKSVQWDTERAELAKRLRDAESGHAEKLKECRVAKEGLGKRFTECETRFNTCGADLATARAKLKKLEETFATNDGRVTELVAQVEQLEREKRALQESMDEVTKQKRDVEQEKVALVEQHQMEIQEEVVKARKAEVAKCARGGRPAPRNVQEDLQQVAVDCSAERARISELESRLQLQIDKHNDAMRSQTEAHREEMSKLEAKLSAAVADEKKQRDALKQFRAALAKHKEAYETLRKSGAEAEKKADALSSDLEKAKAALKKAEAKKIELLAAVSVQRDEHEAAMRDALSRADKLQKSLEEYARRLTKQDGVVGAKADAIARLQAQLSECNASKRDCTSALSKLKKDKLSWDSIRAQQDVEAATRIRTELAKQKSVFTKKATEWKQKAGEKLEKARRDAAEARRDAAEAREELASARASRPPPAPTPAPAPAPRGEDKAQKRLVAQLERRLRVAEEAQRNMAAQARAAKGEVEAAGVRVSASTRETREAERRADAAERRAEAAERRAEAAANEAARARAKARAGANAGASATAPPSSKPTRARRASPAPRASFGAWGASGDFKPIFVNVPPLRKRK